MKEDDKAGYRVVTNPDRNMKQTVTGQDPATVRKIVKDRGEYHYRVFRLRYLTAAVLVIAAVVIPIFAPPGRETLSYMASAALLLALAGMFGFSRIRLGKGRTSIEVEADEDDSGSE